MSRHACVIALLGVLACSDHAPRAVKIDPAAPVRVVVSTPEGDVAVTVEVADTPKVIERGLMGRSELRAEHGMLFFMGREKDWAFWMRDTLIPLDIIFITRQLTVAGVVHQATPRSEQGRRVGSPSLYVLEVNGGWAEQHGVSAGAKVAFDNLRL